ncbi:MAG: 16S rRNA (cytosine(967)-C(5))-methyltransferase RsmB [Caldimicrobium sp.]|nr:16S rRNA (cytosine(967)-C(5))-methyltransferase RsmB [Caldimicrobium sp.]
MNPRSLALKTLLIWEKKKPPLDELLSEILTKEALRDERDRALVNNLVLGVVRHLGYLDFIINRYSQISLNRIDAEVRNALRLGIFQLLFTRIPDRVALAETLKILLQRGRAKWVRGFVNALLHRVSSAKSSLPEPPKAYPTLYLSVKYSFPQWLILKWQKRWSVEELEALLKAANEIPPLVVRTNITKISRDALLKYLQEERLSVKPCPYSPVGIIIEGFRGRVTDLRGFKEGFFSVQDSASQLVSLLLQPRPGERVLDACAGLGGKTTHIAEIAGNKVLLYAVELYPRRLELLKENFNRLNLTLPSIFTGDVLEVLSGFKKEYFDRILLDAPCTGTGIIRRHPDIKWTRTEKDLEKLPQKQLALLEGVAPYVKKGGVILYATCSLEQEENEDVVARFLEANPSFKLLKIKPLLCQLSGDRAEDLVENQYYFRTYPHKVGLDGFFSVVLERLA